MTFRASAEQFDETMWLLSWTLFGCCGAGGLVAALAASTIARTTLRPLKNTAAVIGSIDERALDRRLDAMQLPPELRPMAANLNDMLARLEQSFAQRKQFLADASHELRRRSPHCSLRLRFRFGVRARRPSIARRSSLRCQMSAPFAAWSRR